MSKIFESLSKEEIIRELSRFNLTYVNDTDIAQDYSAHFCISTMKVIESLGKELEAERAKVEKTKCCENCAHRCFKYDYIKDHLLNTKDCTDFSKWKLKE